MEMLKCFVLPPGPGAQKDPRGVDPGVENRRISTGRRREKVIDTYQHFINTRIVGKDSDRGQSFRSSRSILTVSARERSTDETSSIFLIE